MTQAKPGDKVKIHYTGTLEDGTEFDSSLGRDPLGFTIGEGKMIEGVEQAVIGMKVGGNKTVTIPVDQAYGPHRKELVKEIDRSELPDDIELEQGMKLRASSPGREPLSLTVTEITDTTVTVDANHPLAGQELTFDIELVEIA